MQHPCKKEHDLECTRTHNSTVALEVVGQSKSGVFSIHLVLVHSKRLCPETAGLSWQKRAASVGENKTVICSSALRAGKVSCEIKEKIIQHLYVASNRCPCYGCRVGSSQDFLGASAELS